MTNDEIERKIMTLLREQSLSWGRIKAWFPVQDENAVDKVMLKLENCGAILRDKFGRYERYD